MSKIRYLAMTSHDPDALAAFYMKYLGMSELGRNADGDVSLTDGGFNLTLMRLRDGLHEPRLEPGFHHLGIAVDSIEEIKERYLRFNPSGVIVPESGDLQHGEVRIHDPEANPISLSERNFGVANSEPGIPRIAHVALNALNTRVVFDFYSQVFGFRELTRAHAARQVEADYRNLHVGDGETNVAIQVFYNEEEGFHPRFGIAHMGFLVNDSKTLSEAVKEVGSIIPRPASRQQSEVRIRDPQGNGCDLSQRGWEVDTDKWVSAQVA